MKICELIEWLKKEDPLLNVEIEIKDPEFSCITTFVSDIEEVQRVDCGVINKLRIIAKKQGKFSYDRQINNS